MSEMKTMMIAGETVSVRQAEDGHAMLETDFGSLEEFLGRAKSRYDRERADYFDSWADDPAILKKTRRWQKAALEYMRWAETLFIASADDAGKRKDAVGIMDRITKESAVRHKNVIKHAELARAKEPDDLTELARLEAEEDRSGAFLRSAVKTQVRFMELLKSGGIYSSAEFEAEQDVSERIHRIFEEVLPKDRIFIPGRIIPPHRIPAGERVPYTPDVYDRVQNLPVEALEYSEEADELVVKKGYVSEDGLIDDQSLTYDPEAGTATMKYRGGIPVTWPYWKARNLGDIPEPGSWAGEYLFRMYQQLQRDARPGVLKADPLAEEVPDYDRIPLKIPQ